MDGYRFDSLTRTFTSRRGNLKTLLGGALGILIAGRADEQVLAGCKKVNQKCDKNKDCCDGAKCKGGKHGECKCKSGLFDCDGTCASLANDDLHCGGCGVACPEGLSCSDGSCCVPITPPFAPFAGFCSSGQECCGNALCCTFNDADGPVSICIDVLTHTTACGLSCDSLVNCFNTSQICVNGVCVDK